MAGTQVVDLPATFKFIWKINNFSKLNNEVHHYSDVFVAGGTKWKAVIYPKGFGEVYDHLTAFLVLEDSTNLPVDAEFSFAVICTSNSSKTVRDGRKYQFGNAGQMWGFLKLLPLSRLHDPKNGYIRRVQVGKIPEPEPEKQNTANDGETSLQLGEYPDAGQPFEGGRSNVEGSEFEEGLYEEIGGFSILKKQVPLYEQIWLKYGHIPSTKVIPASSYYILVMVVKDIMNSAMDMHQCHFIDLSNEMIELWEEKIKMAERLEFNVKWLRQRFESVKKGLGLLGGMQKFKAELQEQGQSFRAVKSTVRAIEGVLRIAQM
ncbi:MATH domain and coiled-coil domain-containing protein At3g58200-like [Papaver somniferum]|uniref:MATH domain and coiled-coil domain-containing protein At3g58200-like n=1 Tax=Papaver somniferum TaxID=3469 RepID=UPI000E6F9048|nr:MATH domain and coiled-coil domain-containing protein At3g58200-like [Papaver somniferum]